MKKKLINPLVIGLISAGMVVGCTPSTPAKKAKVTGIEVAERPTKTEYYVNETISLDGLVVNAKFDNGKTEVISDYTTNVDQIDMTTAGSKPVTITYQEKFSTTFSIRVSELPREDWTNDEKALMQEHLYGEILPVVIYQAAEVSYDEESKAVVVEGGTVYRGELESYAAKFTDEAGWEGGDISEEQELPAGSLYQFEKAVTVEEQTRYVVVLFGAMSSSGAPAQTGTFHLEANDPYLYEFPGALIGYYLSNVLSISTKVSVPDFGAPRYLYSFDPETYAFAIFGFDATEAMLTAFAAALQEAHWISGGLDKYGYAIAVSPDEKFQISFFFDAEEELFSLYVEECSLWPSNTIAALLAEKNLPNETVPALTGEGYVFALDDSGKYGDIEVGVYNGNSTPDEIVTAYQALLTAAEYTPANTTDDYPVYISKSGNVEVTPYVYTSTQSGSQSVYITINAYGIYPVVAWPSEAIAAILTAKSVATDVVPAFNNAANVTVPEVSETATRFTLTVDVASGSAEDAVATYIDSLEEAGYAVAYKDSYGDAYYVSENKELTISPYVTETQSFKILVTFGDSTPASLGWPAAKLQAALATYTDVTITDTVPADGLSLYAHSINDDQAGTIQVYAAVGTADLIAELSAYAKALTDAGYTLKAGTQNTYVSPNAQLEVTFGAQQSYVGYYFVVQIDIQGLPPQVWPADKIAAILGEEITDPIPSIDGARKYIFDDSGYYALIEIGVVPFTTAGSKTAAQILSEYVAALTEAKYTELGSGNDGTIYLSENSQITVCPYIYGSTVYVDINLAPLFDFPADLIEEFFSIYEVTPDVIPYTISADSGSFEVEETTLSGHDALNVYCNNSTRDDLDAYLALLDATDSGWTFVKEDNYGDKYYTDGNGAYVFVQDYSSYDYGYDILTFYYEEPVEPGEWPAEDIAAAMELVGLDYEMPAFPEAFEGVEVDCTTEKVFIDVTLGEADPFDALDTYFEALATADETLAVVDYVIDETDPDFGKVTLTGANGTIQIILKPVESAFGNVLAITVSAYSPSGEAAEYPAEGIEELLPGSKNVVPAPTNVEGVTSFSFVQSGEGNVDVTVNCESADAATAFSTAFLAQISSLEKAEGQLYGSYDGYICGEFVIVIYESYGSTAMYGIMTLEFFNKYVS